MRTVLLSDRELSYLGSFLPDPLRDILANAVPAGGARWAVELSDSVAEEFRSAFTDRLAQVGFDLGYELNQDGEILEAMIDKFAEYFQPKS